MGTALGIVGFIAFIGGTAWLAEKSTKFSSALDIIGLIFDLFWTIGFRLLLWLVMFLWLGGTWSWILLSIAIVVPVLLEFGFDEFEFIAPAVIIAEIAFHSSLFVAINSYDSFWPAVGIVVVSLALQYRGWLTQLF